MLGVDTNVLVRFLVRDDAGQFKRAKTLIQSQVAKSEPVVVSLLVLLETEWVLRSRYEVSASEFRAMTEGLLDSGDVAIEDEASVEAALSAWDEHGGDFADALIGERNRTLGCDSTVTFDSKAAKLDAFQPV